MTLHHGSQWPQSHNVRGLNKFLTTVVLAITWGFPSRYFPIAQFPYGNPSHRWQCPGDCLEPTPPAGPWKDVGKMPNSSRYHSVQPCR